MALFGTKPPAQPTIPAETSVALAADGLVCIQFSGEIDGALVNRALTKLRVVTKGRRVRVFVVDTMAFTKIDPSMRGPALEFLAHLKASGTTAGFVATSSTVVRLLATTLGVASGLRIALVDTTELAMKRAHAALKGAKDA